MKELVSQFEHLLATLVTLVGPGGIKAVVAQNLLLKHQLLIINFQTLTEAVPQPLCLPGVVFGPLVIISEPTPALTQRRSS